MESKEKEDHLKETIVHLMDTRKGLWRFSAKHQTTQEYRDVQVLLNKALKELLFLQYTGG